MVPSLAPMKEQKKKKKKNGFFAGLFLLI